jgi:hypothetical protein
MIYTGTIPTNDEICQMAEEKIRNLKDVSEDYFLDAQITSEEEETHHLKEVEIIVYTEEEKPEYLFARTDYAESNPSGKEFQTELDYS